MYTRIIYTTLGHRSDSLDICTVYVNAIYRVLKFDRRIPITKVCIAIDLRRE